MPARAAAGKTTLALKVALRHGSVARGRSRAFPGLAGETGRQLAKDVPTGNGGVPVRARRDQRLDVPAEPRVGKLLEEVRLELCAAHALAIVLEIATETLHHAVGIDRRSVMKSNGIMTPAPHRG